LNIRTPALAVLLTACAASSAAAANLLSNPGFESGDVSAWEPFAGAATLTRVTDESHDGAASLFVHNRTQTYGGPSQDVTASVTSGTRYIVSAWVKMASDDAVRPSLNIKRMVGGSTSYLTIHSMPTSHTRWVKLSGVYEHPAEGTTTEVRVYVHGPATDMDFWVDDLQVEPFPTYVTTPSTPDDFVRRSGAGLVVGAADTPIQLRGVNFTAYGDETDGADSVLNGQEVDPEVDYQRVADLGGNVVRLNLWWKVFEISPFTYSDAGWAWLERHIVAARAAGIYLILDMHAPQGGFQGPGYSGSYWSSPSLQARHEALLAEIAGRYRDEPWIAAIDVLNEPSPPNDAAWRARAVDLVAAVRAADPNRLVIVEQSFAEDYGPFTIADPDVVYEFHWYERWRWVSQLTYPSAWGDYGITYPDADATVPPWDRVEGDLQPSAAAPTGTSGWTWVQGTPFTLNDPNVFGAIPVAWASSMTGKMWVDDFVVEELDAMDNVVHTLTSIDIEKKPTEWWLLDDYDPFLSFTIDWSANGSGSWGTENSGHRGSASISIRSAGASYSVGTEKTLVALKQGRRYRVSGWIRTEAMTGSGGLGLRLQEYASWDSFTPFTKAHLEQTFLEEGMDFYQTAGVPVNIGEVGISPRNLTPERGGAQWLRDTFDLFDAYGASYNYFDWHSGNFGAYTNNFGFPDAAGANQPLLDILADEWGGPGIQNLIAIAGTDQVVRVGALVELDGEATVGTVDIWLWEQTDGPAVVLSDEATASPSFTAPAAPASLRFRLTVTGPGGSSEDTVVVSVLEPCPVVLDETYCLDAAKAALGVDERRGGGEKLKVLWKGIDAATTRASFGNPVNGTSRYSLCLYADTTLAGEFFIDRAGDRCAGSSCWNYAGNGWGYKDAGASASGIRLLKVKPGAAGKGSVKLLGQNNAGKGLSSLPTGVAGQLSTAADVVMQLRVDDGICVSTTMAWTKAAGPSRYAGGK
jgi:endoglucanase